MSVPFAHRHIGPTTGEISDMLRSIGVDDVASLIDQTVPATIRLDKPLDLPEALSEAQMLTHMRTLAAANEDWKTYIGQGYFGTITPAVIRRNIFENPGWYTQYTPYQAEISQGRLEALLNFQTVISELTGLPITNASLLDEGTAAVEAMMLFYNKQKKKSTDWVCHVDSGLYAHTIDVLQTRADLIGIRLNIVTPKSMTFTDDSLCAIIQYGSAQGHVEALTPFVERANDADVPVVMACDLMALMVLRSPGELGADVAFGNSQRFGVPIGFGGPHAAFFATRETYKRQLPGRIIGVSTDRQGRQAFRMALQTREQHIRRDRATSNICTAQALLAIMSGMYAVYHGRDGLTQIAATIHEQTCRLYHSIKSTYDVVYHQFFDTLHIRVSNIERNRIRESAEERQINLWYGDDTVQLSIDETTALHDLENLARVFNVTLSKDKTSSLPNSLRRTDDFMQHPVFSMYRTETQMMRYIKQLENKDLSLVHSMIPLGSCTMKLNAAVQLEPLSWPTMANLHPFVPTHQSQGYRQMITDLSEALCRITGFDKCSLMPNSGAQGEYAGLLTIKRYHAANGDGHRDIVLIPASAHGTNPASAVLTGQEVVVVAYDDHGNIDVTDLKAKAEKYRDRLSALMVTYPSTHGVFESAIVEICDTVHQHGGLVYMDGANMNAQVGLTNPAVIHSDVCHLNLHKTFAIPHGGGGPGMGPICVSNKLAPFLPGHLFEGEKGAVSSAPFGSASILAISYAYIKLLGASGLTQSTIIAILNANYIKSQLEDLYDVLYVGENGRVAHELIIDLRPFKATGISAEDVAKRLIDYGFHAPTLSFPVAGTLMIEPTESESKDELDRFCHALRMIKSEIDEVSRGEYPEDNNVLVNAPHIIGDLISAHWEYPYSREKAAFPIKRLADGPKYWSPVGRVDNAYGDRNLVCTCPPIESYQ